MKTVSGEPVASTSAAPNRTPPSLWPRPAIAIAAVALAVIAPFFWWGNPSGHDFEFHLNSWMEVAQQWSHGIAFPRWAGLADYGFGEPRFIFYPPLSWMLGAALGKILPWKAVPGAYLWLALTLAGASMFFLARRWLCRNDALFAALLYAANPYHLVIVYWRSAFAELLAAAVLPLLLLFLLQLEDDPGPTRGKAVAGLALVVAGAWLSDAPAGVIVNYSLVLLLTAVALARRSLRVLIYGAAGLGLGLLLSAFYLLPGFYEQKWVDIYQAVSEGVRPQDNFLFTQTQDLVHRQFNLVVSLVAVSQIILLALAAAWRRRWRQQLPQAWWMLALWGGISALLMFRFSAVAWNHLPKLAFVQFPWRWLLSLNVACALLLTVAWRRWMVRAAVVLALLGMVIFASRRILPPWWDTAADVAELQDNIATGAGYEGVDEYVPVTADPEQVDHTARRVTYEGAGTDQIHVFEWTADEMTFSVTASVPGKVVLHLFFYPAWQAMVNGRAAAIQARDGTGQIEIPVSAGENNVVLRFTRTWDRTLGGWISLATFMLFACWIIYERKRRVSA